MRRLLLIIFWIAGIGSLCYANSIDIPLMESMVEFSYGDGPKGSTPDPSDPNQIRATLSGHEFVCSYPGVPRRKDQRIVL